jgi:type 1 glutamine amidotransferase
MTRTPYLIACTVAATVLFSSTTRGADASKPNVKAEWVEKIKAALPEKAVAKPKQARKVLIFSKTNGFRHSSIPVGTLAVMLLGEKTGAFTAVHSEDDATFEPDKLKEFDLVIMLNTTGELFLPPGKERPKDEAEKKKMVEREERLKQSLVDFVKGGKGLAGTHSATDTYHNWGEYNKMMGGTFAGHPWHQMVPVKNLAAKHPLNEMFADEGFQINDEIYQFRNDTANPADRKMLLSLDTEKMDVSKGARKDKFYPVSWISKYGNGRTFYCSLGHREEIYWNPMILKHYLAGFQYALGDLEADATPAAK